MPAVSVSVSSSPISVASTNISAIVWQNCTQEFLRPLLGPSTSSFPDDMQCSTLEVPLDWSRPDEKRITLALNRLPAQDQDTKIGELLMNPGGPGGSAIAFVMGMDEMAIRQSFDLIGMDPRGVGLSSPLRCGQEPSDTDPSIFPKDQASFDRLVQDNKAFAQSCIDKSGDMLYHMDTTHVAHDVEAVRIALGGEKLNYLGISYGTQLGAAYAELYPENVRAMALDAVLDHGQTATAMIAVDAIIAEQALERFFVWCDTHRGTCGIHPHNDTAELFDALISKAKKRPIPAPNCFGACRPKVTADQILDVVTRSLRLTRNPPYKVLSQGLANAMSGDASLLATISAMSSEIPGLSNAQFIAVDCLDQSRVTDFSDLLYRYTLSSELAPRIGGHHGLYLSSAQCVGWPAPVTNPPHAVNVTRAPPILLVQSFYDAACAYAWAEGLREQIKGSVLLTRNGTGHGSYTHEGETSNLVDAYLTNLTLPKNNTVVDT